MNRYVIGLMAAGLAASAPAAAQGPTAESADDKRARGEQLARDGRFTEAIDAFKAAEKLEPRARHACLIALAYLRRELWPQAEIFLDQCERRATPADPVPEWVPVAKAQLADRLAAVNVAAVELVVEPAGVDVALTASSFAPDERFAPRTIHLPLGHHVIVATAPGYHPTEQAIDVAGPTAQRVTITLLPVTGPKPGEPPPLPGGPPARAASKVPWIVMGAGGAVALAGAITHVTLLRTARNEMIAADRADNFDKYQAWEARFEARRTATIALYGVGAALVVTGLILDRTVFAHRESSVQVAVVPQAGGGVITLGWSP